MADITIYKNVRFANRIDSEANWVAADPILEPGEIAFVGQSGHYYMVVGCEHKTSMASIVLEPDKHASHIFYPGSGSSGGGGGGGGGSIPIATDSTVGGVKVAHELISGLRLETDGSLSNALIESYDSINQRYVINRLHVKNLSFDQQSESVSSTSNYITVRSGATAGLAEGEVAGLVVENVTGEYYNGFLGINRNNQIIINYLGSPVVGAMISGAGAGYIVAEEGLPYATIVPFAPLTFVEGENTVQYTPDKSESITLTPPVIKVNGQITSYNAELREYNISLDGGLTPENAAKLEQFDNYIAIIENLNSQHINAVEGDGTHISAEMIANGELGQKIKVTHNNIACTNENSNRRYTIQSSSDPNAEGITVITGITLDSKGHVTGISTANIAWVI